MTPPRNARLRAVPGPEPRRGRTGKVVGDHGKRLDREKKALLLHFLRDRLRAISEDDLEQWTFGNLDERDKAWLRGITGFKADESLQRYVRKIRMQEAEERLAAAAVAVAAANVGPAPVSTPLGNLKRLENCAAGQRERRQLTLEELGVIASYPSPGYAWELEHVDGRLAGWSRASFYRAYQRMHPSTDAGLKGGRPAALGHVQHPPRPVESVNEIWAVDVYDLKTDFGVDCDVRDLGLNLPDLTENEIDGLKVNVITFVDEASGFIRGYQPCLGAPTSKLVAAAYGRAARGLVAPDGRVVKGPAMRLRSDQGANLMSAELQHLVSFVGTGLDPVPSYTPQSNGRVERIQEDFGRELALLPGHHSGPKGRSGKKRLDDRASSTLSALLDALDQAVNYKRFEARVKTGPRAGMTAYERLCELVDGGDVVRLPIQDRHLARLALEVGTRISQSTQGVKIDKEYYTSAALERRGGDEDVMVRRFPMDADLAYVHTLDWSFCCLVYSPGALPDDEALAIVEIASDRIQRTTAINGQRAEDRVAGTTTTQSRTAGSPIPKQYVPLSTETASPNVLLDNPVTRALLSSPALVTAVRGLDDATLKMLAELANQEPGDVVTDEPVGTGVEPAVTESRGPAPSTAPAKAPRRPRKATEDDEVAQDPAARVAAELERRRQALRREEGGQR